MQLTMKKIISTVILGIYALSVQSQDLNVIKQQKMFFVLFDAKDEYMRKIDLSRNKRDSIYNYIY